MTVKQVDAACPKCFSYLTSQRKMLDAPGRWSCLKCGAEGELIGTMKIEPGKKPERTLKNRRRQDLWVGHIHQRTPW